MANWYVQFMGEIEGPFQDAQLKAMANAKQLDRETPVRRETTGDWVMAGTIKGLFSSSTPTPPPRQSAPPMAIPVATAPAKSRKWPWILLAGFFGLPIAMCSGCLMLGAIGQASRQAELNRPEPENYAHLPAGPLSYSELVFVSKGLTDTQWELYSKRLTGKRARWDGGWISDVETKYDGSAEIQVDYDQPGRGISIHELVIPVKKADAAKFTKGERINFDGEIASVTKFVGKVLVKIKPAAIINNPAKLTPIVIPQDK